MKRTAEERQEWESGCHGKLLEEILAFGPHAGAFRTSPVFLRAAALRARERENASAACVCVHVCLRTGCG